MGHRALVAYRTETNSSGPDRFNLHYTHWGALELKLVHEVSPDTPFGDGYVDEEPFASNVTMSEIVTDHLDYLHHEAFYVVDDAYNVAALRTMYLAMFDVYGHGHDGPETATVGHGLLYAPRWHDGEAYDQRLQGEFRGFKDAIQDQIDNGTRSWESGIDYIKQKLGADSVTTPEVADPHDPEQLQNVIEAAFDNAPHDSRPVLSIT